MNKEKKPKWFGKERLKENYQLMHIKYSGYPLIDPRICFKKNVLYVRRKLPNKKEILFMRKHGFIGWVTDMEFKKMIYIGENENETCCIIPKKEIKSTEPPVAMSMIIEEFIVK